MEQIMLWIGVGLIIFGWLALAYFSMKQLHAQKEYGNLTQAWAEIKAKYVHKRWICRAIILLGLVDIIFVLIK